MSTSPSWFDQDKLSNLAKKVGKKTVTEVLPTNIGASPEARPTENLASTARISLVSKPPSLLSDQRALPALPRRTGTLPSIKTLFPNSDPSVMPEPLATPGEPKSAQQHGTDSREPHPVIPSGQDEGDLSEIWHKMSLLNEELAKTVLERDQAQSEGALLREQLKRADEALKEADARDEAHESSSAVSSGENAKLVKERDDAIAEAQFLRAQILQAKDAAAAKEKESKDAAPSSEEIGKLTKERDDAITEGQALRAQLLQAKEAAAKEKERELVPAITPEELSKVAKERDNAMEEIKSLHEQLVKAKERPIVPLGDTQEITIVTGERDQSRRQYADLRKLYETLKAEQAPKEETVKYRKEWEQQLEERDKEIAALKAAADKSDSGDEKTKQELISLREQLTRTKDEASVAQRGLALSQKALQQTRDTLREATEGTSLSRHNFDNLKNECAILAQQNTVLQAQNDQLSRDLNASKSKITTRLSH